MTTAYLLSDLKQDEGLRLHAYPDPLTGSSPFTVGYGHTGPQIHPDTRWTLAQAEDALAADVAAVIRGLDARLPWWRTLNDPRQDVLVEMAFNMGVEGLLGFTRTLAFIKAGDWKAAHDGLLASVWARQVKARAQRLALQMETGARP